MKERKSMKAFSLLAVLAVAIVAAACSSGGIPPSSLLAGKIDHKAIDPGPNPGVTESQGSSAD